MKPIPSRRINAYPKVTNADTQYWDLDGDDEAYIYQWLYRLLADMSETCTFDADMQKEWFRRRHGFWPKGKNGPNSHASILGGICSAKLRDSKKNLSTAQLDAVEVLFEAIAHHYSAEPNPPEAVVFDRRLFTTQ
jgi:hypothetical protein